MDKDNGCEEKPLPILEMFERSTQQYCDIASGLRHWESESIEIWVRRMGAVLLSQREISMFFLVHIMVSGHLHEDVEYIDGESR